MLYQAHARDRKAWIALVCAGHPNPEVDPDGPSLHASSRLCKTRDAQLEGRAAASSDWTVAETQPSHTNSSPDQAFQLRHDKYTSQLATNAGQLDHAGLCKDGQLASSAALVSMGAAASFVAASAASLLVLDAPFAAASAASLVVTATDAKQLDHAGLCKDGQLAPSAALVAKGGAAASFVAASAASLLVSDAPSAVASAASLAVSDASLAVATAASLLVSDASLAVASAASLLVSDAPLAVASAASRVVAEAPSAAASAASLLVHPHSWGGWMAISRSLRAFSREGISLEPNLDGLAPPGTQLPSPPPSPPSETPLIPPPVIDADAAADDPMFVDVEAEARAADELEFDANIEAEIASGNAPDMLQPSLGVADASPAVAPAAPLFVADASPAVAPAAPLLVADASPAVAPAAPLLVADASLAVAPAAPLPVADASQACRHGAFVPHPDTCRYCAFVPHHTPAVAPAAPLLIADAPSAFAAALAARASTEADWDALASMTMNALSPGPPPADMPGALSIDPARQFNFEAARRNTYPLPPSRRDDADGGTTFVFNNTPGDPRGGMARKARLYVIRSCEYPGVYCGYMEYPDNLRLLTDGVTGVQGPPKLNAKTLEEAYSICEMYSVPNVFYGPRLGDLSRREITRFFNIAPELASSFEDYPFTVATSEEMKKRERTYSGVHDLLTRADNSLAWAPTLSHLRLSFEFPDMTTLVNLLVNLHLLSGLEQDIHPPPKVGGGKARRKFMDANNKVFSDQNKDFIDKVADYLRTNVGGGEYGATRMEKPIRTGSQEIQYYAGCVREFLQNAFAKVRSPTPLHVEDDALIYMLATAFLPAFEIASRTGHASSPEYDDHGQRVPKRMSNQEVASLFDWERHSIVLNSQLANEFCFSCGSNIIAFSSFCSSCGVRQPEPSVAVEAPSVGVVPAEPSAAVEAPSVGVAPVEANASSEWTWSAVIYVRSMWPTKSFAVTHKTTVKILKQMIVSECEWLGTVNYNLHFGGRKLVDDTALLFDEGLAQEATINLVIPRGSASLGVPPPSLPPSPPSSRPSSPSVAAWPSVAAAHKAVHDLMRGAVPSRSHVALHDLMRGVASVHIEPQEPDERHRGGAPPPPLPPSPPSSHPSSPSDTADSVVEHSSRAQLAVVLRHLIANGAVSEAVVIAAFAASGTASTDVGGSAPLGAPPPSPPPSPPSSPTLSPSHPPSLDPTVTDEVAAVLPLALDGDIPIAPAPAPTSPPDDADPASPAVVLMPGSSTPSSGITIDPSAPTVAPAEPLTPSSRPPAGSVTIKVLQGELDAAGQRLATAESIVGEQASELIQLNNTIESLQEERVQLEEEHRTLLLSMKRDRDRLERERANLESQLHTVVDEWNAAVKESKELRQQHTNLTNRVEKDGRVLDIINAEKAKLESQLADTIPEEERLTAEIARLTGALELSDASCAELKGELKRKVEELLETLANREAVIWDLRHASEDRVAERQSEFDVMNDEIRARDEALEEARCERESMVEQVIRLRADLVSAGDVAAAAVSGDDACGVASHHDLEERLKKATSDLARADEELATVKQQHAQACAAQQLHASSSSTESKRLAAQLEAANKKIASLYAAGRTGGDGVPTHLPVGVSSIEHLMSKHDQILAMQQEMARQVKDLHSSRGEGPTPQQPPLQPSSGPHPWGAGVPTQPSPPNAPAGLLLGAAPAVQATPGWQGLPFGTPSSTPVPPPARSSLVPPHPQQMPPEIANWQAQMEAPVPQRPMPGPTPAQVHPPGQAFPPAPSPAPFQAPPSGAEAGLPDGYFQHDGHLFIKQPDGSFVSFSPDRNPMDPQQGAHSRSTSHPPQEGPPPETLEADAVEHSYLGVADGWLTAVEAREIRDSLPAAMRETFVDVANSRRSVTHEDAHLRAFKPGTCSRVDLRDLERKLDQIAEGKWYDMPAEVVNPMALIETRATAWQQHIGRALFVSMCINLLRVCLTSSPLLAAFNTLFIRKAHSLLRFLEPLKVAALERYPHVMLELLLRQFDDHCLGRRSSHEQSSTKARLDAYIIQGPPQTWVHDLQSMFTLYLDADGSKDLTNAFWRDREAVIQFYKKIPECFERIGSHSAARQLDGILNEHIQNYNAPRFGGDAAQCESYYSILSTAHNVGRDVQRAIFESQSTFGKKKDPPKKPTLPIPAGGLAPAAAGPNVPATSGAGAGAGAPTAPPPGAHPVPSPFMGLLGGAFAAVPAPPNPPPPGTGGTNGGGAKTVNVGTRYFKVEDVARLSEALEYFEMSVQDFKYNAHIDFKELTNHRESTNPKVKAMVASLWPMGPYEAGTTPKAFTGQPAACDTSTVPNKWPSQACRHCAFAPQGLPEEQYPLYLQGNPIGSAHNPKKCQASLVTAIMTAFATHTGSANVAADPATAKILKKFIFVFKRETKPSKRD